MKDGVDVSIRQIENGYIISRSWQGECECEGECKMGCGGGYTSQQTFVKQLPSEVKKYFVKGKMGKTDDERVDEMAKDLEKPDESEESE
jgi:hypothetical protein